MTKEKELLKTPVTRLLDDIDRTGMNKGLKGAVTHAVKVMKHQMGRVHLKTVLANWENVEYILLSEPFVGPKSVARIHTHLEAKLAAAKIMDEKPEFFSKPGKVQPDLPMDGLESKVRAKDILSGKVPIKLEAPGRGKSRVADDVQDERDKELGDIIDDPISTFPVTPLPTDPTDFEVDMAKMMTAIPPKTVPDPVGLPLRDEDLRISTQGRLRQEGYPIRIGEPARLTVTQTAKATLIEIRTDRQPEIELTVKIPYIK